MTRRGYLAATALLAAFLVLGLPNLMPLRYWAAQFVLALRGVASSTSLTANQVLIGDGTGQLAKTLGSMGTSGYVLTSNGSSSAPSWQSVANVAGSDTYIQFNDGAAFGTSSVFSFAKTSGMLSAPQVAVSRFNPSMGTSGDPHAMDVHCYTDSTVSDVGFTDENCTHITHTVFGGQNLYGAGTSAKKTFLPLSLSATYYGAGQRFLQGELLNCYGMGDCFNHSQAITFASGDVAGDEGIGFTTSTLTQQQSLSLATISAVTATTCNTTTTQAITASQTAQSVTVASSTNCVVGDWVTVQAMAPTASSNMEAVKITAVSAGHISGCFMANHDSGVTVKPATVVTLSSNHVFGQDRVLVNLTASAYTTGTVGSTSGGGFIGSGTSWATNMLTGGTSLNAGCVSLDNDTYTGSPFSGSGSNGPLRDWYEIASVTDTTHLGIYKTSIAGDAGYRGRGVGSGGYSIRPCARELAAVNSGSDLTGVVILANNGFTWTVSDSVLLAMPPYPDVTALQYRMAAFSNGGTYRGWADVINNGSKTFQYGISLYAGSYLTGTNGADTDAWGTGLSVGSAATGVAVGYPSTGDAFVAYVTGDVGARVRYVTRGGSLCNACGLVGEGDTGDVLVVSHTTLRLSGSDPTTATINGAVTAAHFQGGGTAPAVTGTTANACGTGTPTLAGTDDAGRVTVGGTSGTSCKVTFVKAWLNAPVCTAANETTTANAVRAASSTTLVNLIGTFVAGDVLAYHCTGY